VQSQRLFWIVIAWFLVLADKSPAQQSEAAITANVRKEIKPSATYPWHIIDVSGRDYVTLESVRNFYNPLFSFTGFREQGQQILLMSNKLEIKMSIGSKELLMNNMKFILSLPIISQGKKPLISRLDLVKLVDPILNPSNNQDAEYFDTVVVDAGHGGQDSGESGVYSYEKDFALQMAKHLLTVLMARGFKVVLTRSTGTNLSVSERVSIANQIPRSIFIGLGFYSRSKVESGIETKALSPDGNSPNDRSNIALASAVQARVLSTVKTVDRGISRSQDTLLAGLKSPGIVFLGGNLANKKESRQIASESWQKIVAASIADAMSNYRKAIEPAMAEKPLPEHTGTNEKKDAKAPRTALVMGVGEYGGAKFKGGRVQDLPGVVNADLPGMEAKLKALGFAVTVVANPTLSEAKEAVDAFSAKIKAAPGVSLFYFSGHGGEYEGKNYLIPRGANISSKADLSDEALSAQRVLNGMEESGAQVNLVFLDCCREDLGKSVGGAELQPMKARGSFIGFATRSGDFADPGAEGSPYTRFLLQHLDRPGLSVADMYGYVIKDVKDYTKKMLGDERRPGFYSELEGEPFYFVPVKFTPGSAPAAAAMSEAEIEKRAKEFAAKMAAEAAKPGTTVSVPMAPVPVPVPAPAAVVDPLAGVSKDKPYQNSVGMAFVPAGTPGVFFSVWETRVKDFEAFVEGSGHDAISENAHGEPAYTLESGAEWKQAGGSWRDPRFPAKQSGEHPVVCVNYLDAEAFCAWLTKKERASGKIPDTASYRLPSDSEWSRACGGSEYPWGETYPPKSADGNYLGAEGMVGALAGRSTELSQAGFRDGAARTSAVGMFKENRFGLYDMGGNVYEWCNTWYTADLNDEETKKELSFLKDDQGGMTYRVLRGASWNADGRVCLRSSYRFYGPPAYRRASYGFRCVLVVAGAPPIATSSLPTGNAPPAPAIPADLPATGFFEREELFATGPYADYNTYSQTTILKQVQEQLKKRGHYTGSADGSRGPNTQSGILAYQRANSLPVSGRLDPATLSSLGLTGIQPLTAPKPISKPAAPTKPRAVSDDFFISQ